MSDKDSTGTKTSRPDLIALAIFAAAGAAIAGWSLIAGTVRIVEVVSGRPVDVPVDFVGTEVAVPSGTGDGDIAVAMDRGVVRMPELPSSVAGLAVLQQVVLMATTVTVVVCLVLLSRSVLRGALFGRANTRLVTTAGLVGLVGFGTAPALGGTVGDGAMAHLAGGEFDGAALFTVEPFPFVLAAFAFAIVATAFEVGTRVQRDTEGLV